MINRNRFIGTVVVSLVLVLAACPGWAAKDCEYKGVAYSQRSFTCQGGYGYTCNDGTWDILNTTCSAQPHESSADRIEDIGKGVCACSKDERNLCYANGQVCSSEGDAGKCSKKCK
ncbi:MAG TPA: hypothetical protein VMB78_01575 [Dissulfurispiraceae bacterium]|nr:hypothetical protein [Dissulfurispiraceae bacterium]